LKTLEKLACEAGTSETSSPIAEKLSENFSTIVDNSNYSINDTNRLESTNDDGGGDICPAIYTENLGWLPLLILMVYIFFFNLVRFLNSIKADFLKILLDLFNNFYKPSEP
jgi:hypothetical protein